MLTSKQAPLVPSPLLEIQNYYQKGVTDEFIKPFVTDLNGLIDDHDGIIFVNFRSDRAIRLATALSNPEDAKFFCSPGKRNFQGKKLHDICLTTMTPYSSHVKGLIAFEKENLKNTYGEIISHYGLKQFRIAETEKYPHVTFFFDGGKEIKWKNSDRILIASPRVKTFDLQPEMSAFEVAATAKEQILSCKYHTMILNFANPDMVGHTGFLEATIKSIEVIDKCLKEVVESIQSIKGIAVILSDHGNAEQMKYANGNPHTSHTSNLVPLIITDNKLILESGNLSDVAPTLLELLQIPQPQEMTGKSLILRKKKSKL